MLLHLPTLLMAFRLSLSPDRFRTRHLLYALGFTLAMLIMWLLVFVGRTLDLVLFPGYRRTPIEEPVFIVANPRSGTTFLHRLMCMDDQYTYLKLWHTILPAVSFYKLVGAIARVDAAVGRPLGRGFDALNRKAFGGWEGIHNTGLDRAEEDEQYWVYTTLTPALYLLFPFLGDDELGHVKFVDRLPEPLRAKLTAYFRDCLQRHMYATGGDRTLLAKNALIAGRFHTCYAAVPDMRVVHLVRHPYEAVPSLVSMFSAPWKAHSPHLYGATDASRDFAHMAFEYYRAMLPLPETIADDRYIQLRYDELVADPKAAVERVYEALGLELDDGFRERLERATERAREYNSAHDYDLAEFGLSKEFIYDNLKDVFAAYGFER